MKKIFTLLFFSLGLSMSMSGQVHINEYSAANLNNFLDNYERTEDWIELYNAGDTDVNIGGYHLFMATGTDIHFCTYPYSPC